jgi:hypothetical protein
VLELWFLAVEVVCFSGVAPAGRGGEGSFLLKLCRVVVAEDGVVVAGVGLEEEGWFPVEFGAAAVSVIVLSSVHCEADGSCGLLQAWRCSLPGGWRSGWRFGVSGDGGGAGAGLDPIAFFSAAWGALCKCRGPVCISFSLLDLFVMPLFYV